MQNHRANMQAVSPYHACSGRPLQMFDPFSLFLWDDFPPDFPFRAPMMRAPMMMPPQPRFPQMAPMPRTKIEYKETPEAHHFMAELPGMRKEDVKVHVQDGNMLHISARREHDREENRENYYHVERGCGAFVTSFMLPPNAKPEHMRSTVENGFLTVTVPKNCVGIPASRRSQHVEDINVT